MPSPIERSRLAWTVRLAYVAILLSGTLLPYQPDLGASAVSFRLQRALAVELSTRAAVDMAQNLILFTGWGALWELTSTRDARERSILSATLTGLALSAAVEALQLFSATRWTSVLDLCANTAGAWFGAAATGVLVRTLATRRRASKLEFPAPLLAAGYGGACLVEAVFPLGRRVATDAAAGDLLSRLPASLSTLQWDLTPFNATEGLLVVPAGVALAATVRELGWTSRRSALVAAVGGGVAMILAGAARAVVGYPVEPGTALLHAGGVAAGVGVGRAMFPAVLAGGSTSRRLATLYLAYGVVVCLWAWRPYLPVPDLAAVASQLEPSRLVPLRAHYDRYELYLVTEVLRQGLLFLPLGVALAVWPLRRRGAAAHVLPAIYLAVTVEVGQLFVAGRFPGLTGVLVAAGGAGVGWAVVRRAGYGMRGALLQADRRR